MADSTSTPGDRTVVVHRHSTLTYISLGFNGLILLLILIGIVCGHHKRDRDGWGGRHHHEWADRDGGGFRHPHGFCQMRGEWGNRDFGDRDGGQCPMERRGWGKPGFGGDDHRGFGMDNHQGWDDGGRPQFGGPDKPGFGGGFGGMNGFKAPSADDMTNGFMALMTQKLALTDQESAQIKPIVQSTVTQFQKDMEAQKAAHQKIIADAKAKVRAVLTPDQQKQFDAMTAAFGTPPAPSK